MKKKAPKTGAFAMDGKREVGKSFNLSDDHNLNQFRTMFCGQGHIVGFRPNGFFSLDSGGSQTCGIFEK
jgi:hypothetical protein